CGDQSRSQRVQETAGRSGPEINLESVRHWPALSHRAALLRKRMKIRSIPLVLACAGFVVSQPSQREQPGPLPDGSFLLNSGWKIKPVGSQIPVDTFPMSALFSADGKYLLVLNGGYNPPSISVIDIATSKEIGRTPVPDGWLGLTMSKAGDRVYVGGG